MNSGMSEKEITLMVQERLKNNHFKTPDGYFEQLHQRIIQTIDVNVKQDNAKVVPIRKRGTRYIAIAASVMAIFTLGSMYNAFIRHEKGMTDKTTTVTAHQQNMTTDELDLVADYTMCDNDDIVAFLIDE
ncbi:MAG: hypothetical protein IKT00_07680 [Prevotella sp.]|nr:hypothetical protein [Prevotella sp.]